MYILMKRNSNILLCLVKWSQKYHISTRFCTVWRTRIHQGYHLVNFSYITAHLQSQTINSCAIHHVASDSYNICQAVSMWESLCANVWAGLGNVGSGPNTATWYFCWEGFICQLYWYWKVVCFGCCHCTWLHSIETWHFVVL